MKILRLKTCWLLYAANIQPNLSLEFVHLNLAMFLQFPSKVTFVLLIAGAVFGEEHVLQENNGPPATVTAPLVSVLQLHTENSTNRSPGAPPLCYFVV